MILVNPVTVVLVPFENRSGQLHKRKDLPRFVETAEVIKFMKDNPSIHRRNGQAVHLQWIEHDEAWALREFHEELGRKGREWVL